MKDDDGEFSLFSCKIFSYVVYGCEGVDLYKHYQSVDVVVYFIP
jgi:hypothetical protein